MASLSIHPQMSARNPRTNRSKARRQGHSASAYFGVEAGIFCFIVSSTFTSATSGSAHEPVT